jgi:hypothetical protein
MDCRLAGFLALAGQAPGQTGEDFRFFPGFPAAVPAWHNFGSSQFKQKCNHQNAEVVFSGCPGFVRCQ